MRTIKIIYIININCVNGIQSVVDNYSKGLMYLSSNFWKSVIGKFLYFYRVTYDIATQKSKLIVPKFYSFTQ